VIRHQYIPLALEDTKHRRSAALRDGGYQGEKRDFPPDCKRERIRAQNSIKIIPFAPSSASGISLKKFC